MTELTMVERLAALGEKIAELPPDSRKEVAELWQEAIRRQDALEHDLSAIRDSLDDLRLAEKYLRFEQDATLRDARRAERIATPAKTARKNKGN